MSIVVKEKLDRLGRYLDHLNNRITGPVPEKHLKHPETYKQFLAREITMVRNQIEHIKLENFDNTKL